MSSPLPGVVAMSTWNLPVLSSSFFRIGVVSCHLWLFCPSTIKTLIADAACSAGARRRHSAIEGFMLRSLTLWMARRYSDRKKLRRSCFWSSGRWLKSMPADSFDQIFRPPVVQGKDALSKPPKGAVRNSGQPRAHVVQEMVGEQTQERRKQDQVAGGARPKLIESSESLLTATWRFAALIGKNF